MKKLKKVLLLSGTTLAGVSLLAGCTNASNNNAQSSQSSNNDKKEAEKKPQYDTAGLKEQTIKSGKFFTSFSGKWKKTTEKGVEIAELNESATIIQVTVETNDKLVTGAAKEWSSMSESRIEEMLKTLKPTKLTVKKSEINGKEAFIATYVLKSTSATAIQYYVKLDDTHSALVTYIHVISPKDMEKEVKDITSTVEYIK